MVCENYPEKGSRERINCRFRFFENYDSITHACARACFSRHGNEHVNPGLSNSLSRVYLRIHEIPIMCTSGKFPADTCLAFNSLRENQWICSSEHVRVCWSKQVIRRLRHGTEQNRRFSFSRKGKFIRARIFDFPIRESS